MRQPLRRVCGRALLAVGALAFVACGEAPTTQDSSDLEWVQSRAGSTRYAYLTQADLNDDFIFGASVIGVREFQSGALNMVVRPLQVRLSLRTEGGARKLDVRTSDTRRTLLMSFNVTTSQNRHEVDFASAGNDLRLRSLINTVGGMFTAGDQNGYWVSTGAPRVQNILQDNDTVVVDLAHTVRQAVTRTDANGNDVLDHFVSETPGEVTVRLFLERKKALPRLDSTRTVADGKRLDLGFFGPDLAGDSDDVKIQRFALGDATDAKDSLTFYLKDVPAQFQDTARKAILSWNEAFGRDVLKVENAPANIDAGDPRYNVIKWFNGLDDGIVWAGVAKMSVEPESGLVMGGHVYINGSSLLDLYRGITDYSQAVAAGGVQRMSGTIGNVTFARDEGEKPVIPFATPLDVGYDEYMQGYYLETIAHEVGHVLGLRHNFRGTTKLSGGQSASVMDYAPRAERAHFPGPGSYDKAAIRWGYFGEAPTSPQPFCTDEDIWKFFDCSQGDWGEPVASAVNGLIDGTLLLTQKPIAVTDDTLISSLASTLENALKIKKLAAQLPATTRDAAVSRIDAAYQYLFNAKPAETLPDADKATVEANLTRMKAQARKKEAELRSAGRI